MLFGALNDTHLTICTYAIATGVTKALTNVFKNYIGYLRPNFYNRCDFDIDTLTCNDEEEEQNGRKSFPSGHSSLSFCGMTLFTLYLLRVFGVGGITHGKNHQRQEEMVQRKQQWLAFRRRIISMLCLLPMIICFFVAGSRVHDDRHHPADVVAGSLIGWACAKVVHNIW